MSLSKSGFISGPPRLNYLEWSSGDNNADTIVLVHGNCANAWWWRPLADALGASSWRIIAIDLRGHGDSEWVRPSAYSPPDYADDIARLLQELGLRHPLVAGHSMGGVATLAFARRYPGMARAMVAIDIPVTSTPRRNRYLRHLKSLPTVTYPDLATALRSYRLMPNEGAIPKEILAEIALRSLMRTGDDGYTLKFDRESFFGSDGLDVAAAIARITRPLLLIRAGESRIMTAEAAANAAASNPLVSLATLAGAHHHLPLEWPHELAQAIMAFARANPARIMCV
jgi:pimeloyl-ACP methyl ester carboxylesterase